jgi:MFS family permease
LLIVAGGFGILKDMLGGYQNLFLVLGIVISLCGVAGVFMVKDSPNLAKSGSFKDLFYGFKPSVIKEHKPLYVTLLIVGVYGIACQIFMPYLIIYMEEYLGFDVIEYSVVFALAILLGAGVNVYLTRLSDRMDKLKMLYYAAGIFAAGLLGMYCTQGLGHVASMIVFGIFGFVMITGNILVMALTGSTVRDYTPEGSVGKLQGVRMVFSVLLPMVFGPMIGNAINVARNLGSASENAALTTAVIPAPEIFLAASICALLMFAVIPFLSRLAKKEKKDAIDNEI